MVNQPEPLRSLHLTFAVREDVTSERASDYRNLVVKSLELLRCQCSATEYAMINKLFWDWVEDPEDRKLIDTHAALIVELAALETEDPRVLDLEGRIEEIRDRLEQRSITV